MSTSLEPAETDVREAVHGPRAVEVATNDGRIHGDERPPFAEVLIEECQQFVVALREAQREHSGALPVHFEHANPIRPAVAPGEIHARDANRFWKVLHDRLPMLEYVGACLERK